MAFRIDLSCDLGGEIRRIAGEQLDRALTAAADWKRDPHEAIHEVRKRIKRIRALVRLVRDAAPGLYHAENLQLRDTARSLSAFRDAAALVEAGQALADDVRSAEGVALARLQGKLRARRGDVVDTDQAAAAMNAARLALTAASRRAVDWNLADLGAAHLVAGAGRTFARGAKTLDTVHGAGDDASLHELRKRAKYSRFHHHLLAGAWPAPLGAIADEYDRLADLLGDHHDLAVLVEVLPELALPDPEHRLLEALLRRRRRGLFGDAYGIAQRIYVEKRSHFERRLQGYLDVALASR